MNTHLEYIMNEFADSIQNIVEKTKTPYHPLSDMAVDYDYAKKKLYRRLLTSKKHIDEAIKTEIQLLQDDYLAQPQRRSKAKTVKCMDEICGIGPTEANNIISKWEWR